LWEHAIDLLEAPSLKKGGAIRKGVDKYYMSPATDLVDTPVKISHIYVLNPQNGTSKTVDFQAINYFDGLQLIMEHTHAKGHIIDAKSQKAQFKRLSYLVQTATIKEVKRPLGMKKDKFWDMINLIEQDFLA